MASKIVVNLDTSKELYGVFKCKQNDDLTLEANIYENGASKDLTNCSIVVQAKKADNTYIIQNTDITKDKNKFIVNLVRDFTRVPGETKIEVVLTESSKQNTTFSFCLEVIGSVIRGAEESKDLITSLEVMQDAVVEMGKISEETKELIKNSGAASKEEINKVNTQLAEMANVLPSQNQNVTKLGISIHPFNFDDLNNTVLEWKNSGFKYIRFDAYWWQVERNKGIYDFSEVKKMVELITSNNLIPIIVICHNNEIYATNDDNLDINNQTEVGIYRGDTSPKTSEQQDAYINMFISLVQYMKNNNYTGLYYEFFNEANNKSFDAITYTKMAQTIYTRIKNIDNECKLINLVTEGVFITWNKTCIDNGIIEYSDYVSVHPYTTNTPESISLQYNQLKNYMSMASEKNVPIFLGEIGWSSVPNPDGRPGQTAFLLDEITKAKFSLRSLLLSYVYDLKGTIFYQGFDKREDATNWQQWFGLINNRDYTTSYTFDKIQELYNILKNYSLSKVIEKANDVYILQFVNHDFSDNIIIGWATHNMNYYSSILETNFVLTDMPKIFDINVKNRCFPNSDTIRKIINENIAFNEEIKNPLIYLGNIQANGDLHSNNTLKNGYFTYSGKPKNSPSNKDNDFGILVSINANGYTAHYVYSFLDEAIYYERHIGEWRGYSKIVKNDKKIINGNGFNVVSFNGINTLTLIGSSISRLNTITNLPNTFFKSLIYNKTKQTNVLMSVSSTGFTIVEPNSWSIGSDSDELYGQITWFDV